MLLRIEDNFFNYMKKVQLPTTQQNECNRHQNGMIILAENVQVSLSLWFFAWLFIMFNFIMKRFDSNTWYVPSVSGKISDGYFVRLKMNLCTRCAESTLSYTMSECKKLCYHIYECDQLCYDYTNGHLCKHIHRVHTIWLLETNEDDKDVKSESVCKLCIPNTCELSNGSDFDDNLEFAESLRNPTTGEKNDTSVNLLIRFNASISLHLVYM